MTEQGQGNSSAAHTDKVAAATTVAALYVEKNGVYYGLPGVDPWDEERDARLYAGPWPVVAHPPCARWSVLWPLVKAACGLEPGEDGGCFEAALNAVRTYGGVLEHPALSLAWACFNLPRPSSGGWTSSLFDPGYSTEVSQAAYGHRARKRTWLYYVGPEPPALRWAEPRVAAKVSGFKHLATGEYVADESRRVRTKEAQATPIAFREALLDMARSAGVAGSDLLSQRAHDFHRPLVAPFVADEPSGDDVVGDHVGASLVGVGKLDVQVDEDGAGHGSSFDGTVTSGTLPPSGADCEGRDGDTFLPSAAPVVHAYEDDEATSLAGHPDGNGERW